MKKEKRKRENGVLMREDEKEDKKACAKARGRRERKMRFKERKNFKKLRKNHLQKQAFRLE